MFSVSDRYKEWWRKYDDVEKCKLIKDKAMQLNKNHQKMVKASNSEMQHNGARTGLRGGKITTLQANTQRATKTYLDSLDEFKYMVATL